MTLRQSSAGLALLLALCACDPSNEDCNKLVLDVAAEIRAAPASWSECASDDECSGLSDTSALCVPLCGGPAVQKDHVADLENFLATDAKLAEKCDAYAKSGCDGKPYLFCPAEHPACVANQCQQSP